MDKNLQEQADRIFQIQIVPLKGKWAYSYTDSEGVNRQKYPFDSIGQALTSLIELEDLSAQSNSSEDGVLVEQMQAAVESNKQERFDEDGFLLGIDTDKMTSACAAIAQAYADKQAVEFADWATENLKRLLPQFSNHPNPDNKSLWRCLGLPPFDKEFYETEDLLPIFKKYRRPRNNLVGTQTT